jgi:glycosyltransferase involved in cell wall biosynthesis
MLEKYKVLHVSTTAAGGLGTSLLSIMKSLDPAQFEVHVAIGLGHPLDSAFEAAGFPLHPLPLSRGIHPIQFARTLFQLTRLMQRERFDVLHVHGSEAGILARIAARITGVPVVIAELHGYANRNPDSILERTLYRWIEAALDRMTHAYVAVSKHVERQWLARGICDAQRMQVIYHALDLQAFTDRGERVRPGASCGAPVVGTACLLEARKGLATLIEAMPAVIARVPKVRFAVVGEGPLQPWMQARAAELDTTAHIDFMGWRNDMPELMWQFDLFALPSKRESFGLVFLEAMASRCPVVGTRVDGIPEVVEDGVTGLLVPPDDAQALALAIVDLLTDAAKAKRFTEAGRKRVETLFSNERMAREYNELYMRLLRKTPLHAEAKFGHLPLTGRRSS